MVHLNHMIISRTTIIFKLKCEKNRVHSLNRGWIAFFSSNKNYRIELTNWTCFIVDYLRPFIDWPDLSIFVGFTFHNTFQSLQQVNTIFCSFLPILFIFLYVKSLNGWFIRSKTHLDSKIKLHASVFLHTISTQSLVTSPNWLENDFDIANHSLMEKCAWICYLLAINISAKSIWVNSVRNSIEFFVHFYFK